MKRFLLQNIRYISNKLKSASMRLTKLTGKSSVRLHPKHLCPALDTHTWMTDLYQTTDIVLDIGTGSLAHSLRTASQVQIVYSFDYDNQHLRRGRIQMHEQQINNIRLFKGDAEAFFPLPDQCFDKIIFLDVLEHIINRDRVLSEAWRVLKDNGVMFVAAPNIDTTWKRRFKAAGLFYYADPDHKIEYTKESLKAELDQNGFVIDGEYRPIVYDTPLVGVIDFIGGFSLSLYQMLNRQRYKFLLKYPEETTGWRIICRKSNASLSRNSN